MYMKEKTNSLSERSGRLFSRNKKLMAMLTLLLVLLCCQSGHLFADPSSGGGALSGLGLDNFNADTTLGNSALEPLQKFAKWTLSIFFNTAVVALVFLFFFIKGLRIISRDSAMWLKGAVHIVVAVIYGAGPFVINMLASARPL